MMEYVAQFNPNHGYHGRFSSGGAGGKSGAKAPSKPDVSFREHYPPRVAVALEKAHRDASRGGGFTVDIKTGGEPKSGFTVSHKGAELRVPTKDLTRSVMHEHIQKHIEKLHEGGNFHGGWGENGSTYLDVSRNFSRESDARKFAVSNNQKAYWDVAKQQETYV